MSKINDELEKDGAKDARIKELEAELDAALKTSRIRMFYLDERDVKIKELESLLAEAEGALEFYGNADRYEAAGVNGIADQGFQTRDHDYDITYDNGNKARETLTKIQAWRKKDQDDR